MDMIYSGRLSLVFTRRIEEYGLSSKSSDFFDKMSQGPAFPAACRP